MIAVVDCGIGNIGSLVNAFRYLGEDLAVVKNSERLLEFDAVVLPGVGAFDAAVELLISGGFDSALLKFYEAKKPILGICLGMQLLCNRSDEGELPGLAIVDLNVRFLKELGVASKVPHVGFNTIICDRQENAFLNSMAGSDFYFVHSYAVGAKELDKTGLEFVTATYDAVEFVAAFNLKNVYATQYHPEKSGEVGLKVLREFIQCSKRG